MPKALITGTSSGIGAATVGYLIQHGFHVIAAVRKAADAERLSAQYGDSIETVLLDMTDTESIESAIRLLQPSLEQEGLAALVSNAGVSYPSVLEYIDIDATKTMFETNVFGPMTLIKACLPYLKDHGNGAGRIVNVSSGAGQLAIPLGGTYSASKFALEGYSDALRVELRQQGILVSVIEPGFIESAIHDKTHAERDALIASLDDEGKRLYGAALQRNIENFERQSKKATPAEAVAKAIHHALTAKRPKTRYGVGPDAKLLHLLKPMLFDRLRDTIVGKMVGL